MEKILITRYEAIWTLTKQMLDAANKNQWEELVEIEKNRSNVIEKLQSLNPRPEDPQTDKHVEDLIHNILACDEQIRALTEAWMNELRAVLNNVSSKKKLLKAYGEVGSLDQAASL